MQRAAGSGSESPPAAPDPFAEEEGRRPPLRDGPLDRLMIKLFTGKMAAQLGGQCGIAPRLYGTQAWHRKICCDILNTSTLKQLQSVGHSGCAWWMCEDVGI